jgi:hypothetical protein|tara:strand:+ start:199 stop:684 length:486 start_codon:yes stop_codon:yes gene_type:complete
MKKILLFLTFFLISQYNLYADEISLKKNISQEMRNYNNIEDCTGLALFLGEKQYKNVEFQKVVFSLGYLEEIYQFSHNIIGHKINEDYSYWGNIDFKSWDEVKEMKKELETYSMNLEEFKTLNFYLINECIPIILENANEVLDDLTRFRQNSIRKLTDLND